MISNRAKHHICYFWWILTHFSQCSLFYPLKIFSGRRERVHWERMGNHLLFFGASVAWFFYIKMQPIKKFVIEAFYWLSKRIHKVKSSKILSQFVRSFSLECLFEILYLLPEVWRCHLNWCKFSVFLHEVTAE